MRRLAACLLLLALGRAEGQTFARADIEFFEAKVRPILFGRCFSCHSSEAKKVGGGLFLDSRQGLLRGGASGPAAVPGKPDESRIVAAIRHTSRDLSMPPSGKLSDQETAVLIDWIGRGLPYAESKTRAGSAPGLEEGRKFWSFQPLVAQAAPKVTNGAWVKKPIDAFLLAELEKQGLSPAPPATRRVLIRRAFFDLIGLPPTPEEVETFVRDKAEDAYARLIDRLLASPHHGERWGRHWLDLARYCDVPEPWAEAKGQPHLYRDWVVKALNDDMPYDRFVVQQLAADVVPGAKPADFAALGFLGLSPSYWKELKLAPEMIKAVVAEEWEERIGAVTSTFLGLTVACARCHDHKHDPITMRDYYALAGVFASASAASRPMLPDAEAAAVLEARQRVADLETQSAKLRAAKPVDLGRLKDLAAEIESIRRSTPHYDAPTVPGVVESSLHVLADGPHRTRLEYRPREFVDVAMQFRGSPSSLGTVVPRRFLAVLSSGEPRPFKEGSGRLELARAIVGDAAPLTARVIVNRVWKLHFGRGLVDTPSDFGAQGDRPTHPALLDDLAARFLANRWSLRWLHREIMLSAAYQQSSAGDDKKQALDPDNRFLWRMRPRRLDVEAWRDAMLAVSGTLDRAMGGPALDLGDAANTRRTIYGLVKRRELHDLLRLHDFPDPTAHSAHRVPTVTPLQQLFVLNSLFIQQQAEALALRLKKEAPGSVEARIERAYRLLFGREPTAAQMKLGLDFLTPESNASWQQYAQVLLGSNEFLFVD